MTHGAVFTSLVFGLLLAGCASSGYQEPTHRWISTVHSNSVEYRADNSRCMREIAGEAGQRVFAVGTPEYDQYVVCMNSLGYELTAMNSRP